MKGKYLMSPPLHRENSFLILDISDTNFIKRKISEYLRWDLTVSSKELENNLNKFYKIINEEFTPFVSEIILDSALISRGANIIKQNSGVIIPYKMDNYSMKWNSSSVFYSQNKPWSVKKAKKLGANAIKSIIYYDGDTQNTLNRKKEEFILALGKECKNENILFFLEIRSFDSNVNHTIKYVENKPHKIISSMREFSKSCYHINALFVEFPVSISCVEGFSQSDIIYSRKQAAIYIKEQSKSTKLPYLFISDSIPQGRMKEALNFAKDSTSDFSGLLIGSNVLLEGLEIYIKEGTRSARSWCRTIGRQNIGNLNHLL